MQLSEIGYKLTCISYAYGRIISRNNSERPKLYTVLAFLGAIGLSKGVLFRGKYMQTGIGANQYNNTVFKEKKQGVLIW